MGSAGRKRVRRAGSAEWAEPLEAGRTGLGDLEHNQWTFEGEIERLGAFASGARRARGWKRAVAWLIAASFLLPLAIGALSLLLQ